MDRETLIARLVDHSRHPRHKGRLERPDVSMPGGNPGCGDVVTLHVRAGDEGGRVAEASFEGEGCTISMGATSMLLQRVNRERLGFDEVLDFSYEEMLDMVGREVVEVENAGRDVDTAVAEAGLHAERAGDRVCIRVGGRSARTGEEIRAALAHRFPEHQVILRNATLEDVFLSLTGRELRE